MISKKIILLATGGTIAGVGAAGKSRSYTSGVLLGKDLLHFKTKTPICVEQICNINSDDITSSIWLKLAHRITTIAQDKNVQGVIITHGTDTLEETAFFLALTLQVKIPILLTGAMRPSTAKNPDGPTNLKFAIQKIQALKSGIFIAFNGALFNPLRVQKINNYKKNAFKEIGKFNFKKEKFDIKNLKKLPPVNTLYFHAESSVQVLKAAAKCSQGLVIAGAGAGEFSLAWQEFLSTLKIPIVISSRVLESQIDSDALLLKTTIAAGELPPAKAAILLRLALTQTKNCDEIKNFF